MAEKKGTKNKNNSQKVIVVSNTENLLIENFVALQKVMTHLSLKFDDLSGKISKLLDLFELSAKSLSEGDLDIQKQRDDTEELLKKMNDLAEQNKILARGITLLHEKKPEEKKQPQLMNVQRPITNQITNQIPYRAPEIKPKRVETYERPPVQTPPEPKREEINPGNYQRSQTINATELEVAPSEPEEK